MNPPKTSHDSETPAVGQQAVTVCAFIHHNFDGTVKVFLPKRAQTKKFLPGVYELPGGHVDFGEDLVVALKREVKEEFGKDIEVGDPFAAFAYPNEIKGSHSTEIVYFARFVGSIDDIQLNPEDHSEYVWLAEQELEQAYTQAKGADDPEAVIRRKGFALLRGEPMAF